MKASNSLRRNASGQVLIITSLVVILLMLSTVLYVNNMEKDAPIVAPDENSNLSAIKQSAVHSLVSALVNVSNGGDPSVLSDDLLRFKTTVEGSTYNSFSELNYTFCNLFPYANGFSISWGKYGQGSSSVDVDFSFNSTGTSGSYFSEYSINVTSTVSLTGNFSVSDDSTLAVSLSCSVLNEGEAALARNISVFYQQLNGVWVSSNPNIFDFGNGTYSLSFTAQNVSQVSLPVSVGCIDSRGVSIWANDTLSQG